MSRRFGPDFSSQPKRFTQAQYFIQMKNNRFWKRAWLFMNNANLINIVQKMWNPLSDKAHSSLIQPMHIAKRKLLYSLSKLSGVPSNYKIGKSQKMQMSCSHSHSHSPIASCVSLLKTQPCRTACHKLRLFL